MNLNQQLKAQAQNISVLYAEDEKETREQISQILELFFLSVAVADDGDTALELYKQNKVDLIITDLTMPNMNGAAMVKQIKEIEPDQHVLILTAHNSSEYLRETIDLQIDGFLLKPMKMDKMLELLIKVTKTINLEKDN